MLNSSSFRKLITIENARQNAFIRHRVKVLLPLERKYKSYHHNVVNEAKKAMSKYEQLKLPNASNDELRLLSQKARKLSDANKKLKVKLMKWKPELTKRREKLAQIKKQRRKFSFQKIN